MHEFIGLKQHPEGFRRLFTDDYFDLYIWYAAEGGEIVGFQLVYDKEKKERALTWRSQGGYAHDGIDEGQRQSHTSMSPVLVADGVFAKDEVMARFRLASQGMEEGLRRFILEHIEFCEPSLTRPSA